MTLVLAISVRADAEPPAVGHPDGRALRRAGWERGFASWELVRVAAAITGAGAGWIAGAPLAGALIGAAAPSVWIRLRAEAAHESARRQLTVILATTEAALRSGLALPEALRRGLERASDPLAGDRVAEALRAFDLGGSLDTALERAAERADDPRERLALSTLALGIGERLPRERLADLVMAMVDRLRFEDDLADQVRARASGVRQQQRILALLVPAMAVYLAATMPVLAGVLASEVGRYVLVPAAVALEAAGILLSRRIVGEALA